MIRYIFSAALSILVFGNASFAQRYKETIFSSIDSLPNLLYGEGKNLKNEKEDLFLDLYFPHGDSVNVRPVVVFIHGGGFVNGSRKNAVAQQVCKLFTSKGYVTASISYRLGIDVGKSKKDYTEAMYRAQQDGRSAIRFLKANAEKWRLDTSQFFLAGSSAGAMTSLAIAYMNDAEIPEDIDQQKWGPLEGQSINMYYSSSVKAVLNFWGAMIDHKWINDEKIPLYNTAGTLDKLVPSDSSFDYHGFKFGPSILFSRSVELGIPTTWRPFYGVGHTLDSKKLQLDSCFQESADWLFTRLKINAPTNDIGVKRWEAEILRFDSLNMSEKHGNDAVLFIGSSYIRLWKNIRNDLKYEDIIHRGFGGSNLADVSYYAKHIIYPHHPKAIFLYVGNDIVGGSRDKTPLQVLELFKYVVKIIRAAYPKIPITWLAISPSERRWSVWNNIQEANKLIENYCLSTDGLFFLSATEKFIGNDAKPNKSLFLDDKLHYNEKGYTIWGKAIRKDVHRIINTTLN